MILLYHDVFQIKAIFIILSSLYKFKLDSFNSFLYLQSFYPQFVLFYILKFLQNNSYKSIIYFQKTFQKLCDLHKKKKNDNIHSFSNLIFFN